MTSPSAPLQPGARSPARRAAVSSAWLLMENLLRLLVTAAISFWAARALGPADFGLLNFASALAAILYAMATLGLELPVVTKLARIHAGKTVAGVDHQAARTVLGTALRLRFVASLGALLLAAAAAWLLRHGDARAQAVMLIVSLSVVAYVPMVFDFHFKACVEAGPPARARLATTLLSALAKAAVLMGGYGVQAMAWTVVLEAVLAAGLLGLAWRRHFSHEPPLATRDKPVPGARQPTSRPATLQHHPALAASLLRRSLPLLGASAAVALQLKADVVLLGHFAPDAQVGAYALAQKLTEVLLVLPVVLVDSVYPLLLRAPPHHRTENNRADKARAEAGDQLMFDLAAAAGMVCCLTGLLLAAPLIVGVFGAAYEAAVPLWRWHALTCLAVALDVARQRWLVARGLQKQALFSAGLGAVLGIGLNLVLIPLYGATAAAAVSVLAWSASGLLATAWWHTQFATRPLAGLQLRALWPWGRLARLLVQSLRGART